MDKNAISFLRLVKIMDELREQCPWDKKQTIQSLRHLTIEETYELVDAIDQNDFKGIKEELGDLLLHILFYSKIGAEKAAFNLSEMIDGICEKLIHRHPHIYGDVKVENEEDVKRNWEQLKLKEGKTSILAGVPKALPAVVKAMRLQEKAELLEAIALGDKDKMEDELGDVFFSLINFARFLQLDAEKALERTNKKFIERFKKMEIAATAKGKNLSNLSLEEMDEIWNEIKHAK
jgi:uncharacterized protein YabN with tetrapyrrole methylase and pyrophosphatase domain